MWIQIFYSKILLSSLFFFSLVRETCRNFFIFHNISLSGNMYRKWKSAIRFCNCIQNTYENWLFYLTCFIKYKCVQGWSIWVCWAENEMTLQMLFDVCCSFCNKCPTITMLSFNSSLSILSEIVIFKLKTRIVIKEVNPSKEKRKKCK